MFVHMAIDTLGVAPEKKAQLDKIQSDLFTAMAPARDANRAVIQALADGVAAGKIDTAKVDAAVAKENAAAGQVHGATIDALNALHKALSPEERMALMDKVQAHAAVWKKVNVDEDPTSKAEGTHLAKLTESLSLTPDEVDKISTAIKTGEPPKPDTTAIDAHLKALETAFVTDTFDAKTLTTANAANGAIAKHGTARMVHFYEAVTPILTPDQRTKLADHLKQRLNDHHATASATTGAANPK
jgi:Spy/CpxP family protein refolding chaperone